MTGFAIFVAHGLTGEMETVASVWAWVVPTVVAAFALGILVGRRWALPGTGAPSQKDKDREARPEGSDEIYVGNLPYEATEQELRKLFRKYGKVVSARVISNKGSGKSKGFGFVEMRTPAQTDAAVQGVNGKEMGGRKLVVNRAR